MPSFRPSVRSPFLDILPSLVSVLPWYPSFLPWYPPVLYAFLPCVRPSVLPSFLPACHGLFVVGPIPPELGNLQALTVLLLGDEYGGNQISGSLPIELSKLLNLTFLSVRDNCLTGLFLFFEQRNVAPFILSRFFYKTNFCLATCCFFFFFEQINGASI